MLAIGQDETHRRRRLHHAIRRDDLIAGDEEKIGHELARARMRRSLVDLHHDIVTNRSSASRTRRSQQSAGGASTGDASLGRIGNTVEVGITVRGIGRLLAVGNAILIGIRSEVHFVDAFVSAGENVTADNRVYGQPGDGKVAQTTPVGHPRCATVIATEDAPGMGNIGVGAACPYNLRVGRIGGYAEDGSARQACGTTRPGRTVVDGFVYTARIAVVVDLAHE